jgi:SAM-dependent methyltransferase
VIAQQRSLAWPSATGRCPLCGAPSGEAVYRLRAHTIVRCAACDAWFNGDFSGGGDRGELFSEPYFTVSHREAFDSQARDPGLDASAPAFLRWLAWVEARVGVGRVLDVGCAFGTFLVLARERGWQVAGVEVSRFAAARAASRQIDVTVADFRDYQAPPGSFDLVTFWDSLEHLTRPVQALSRAASLVRPGGLVLVATDNFDCLVGDIARAAYRWTGGRVTYPMERVFIDRNSTFLTAADLRRLLEQARLRIVAERKMEYPLSKIRTSRLERWTLRALYGAGWLLRRQAQVTFVAERPQESRPC